MTDEKDRYLKKGTRRPRVYAHHHTDPQKNENHIFSNGEIH